MSYWITQALEASEFHQRVVQAQEVLFHVQRDITDASRFRESMQQRLEAQEVLAPYANILRKSVFKCPCFFAPVAQLPIGPGWGKWDSTEWFQALVKLGQYKGQPEFLDLRAAMGWILKEYGILLRPHVDKGNPLVWYSDSEDDVLSALVRFNQDVYLSSGKKDRFRGSDAPNPLSVEEARAWLYNSGQARSGSNSYGVIPLEASLPNSYDVPNGPITSEELFYLLMPTEALNELISEWQGGVILSAGINVAQVLGDNKNDKKTP
jgi:hypothetical protein